MELSIQELFVGKQSVVTRHRQWRKNSRNYERQVAFQIRPKWS